MDILSQQVMDFTAPMVATFIAVVGILSVVAQTALLSLLMKQLSNKHVIMVGASFIPFFGYLLFNLLLSCGFCLIVIKEEMYSSYNSK